MKPVALALLGALTGAVAATACLFLRLGELSGIEIAGYCFGIKVMHNAACTAVDGALYLYPGIVFGIVFGPLLWWKRRLNSVGAAGYAAAAGIANAAAVFVCVSLQYPFDDLLPHHDQDVIVNLALGGVVGGAVGASLLGFLWASLDGRARPRLSIVVAAGLGVLTPFFLMFEWLGVYGFYVIWQSGYAFAIAASFPDDVTAGRGRPR